MTANPIPFFTVSAKSPPRVGQGYALSENAAGPILPNAVNKERQPARTCRSVTGRAFTLVELLVVIGIVTVLIALLFPALSRAKEHANRIKCAANPRSIGQAIVQYTQQSSYYPIGDAWTPSLSGLGVWPTLVRPLLGHDQSIFYCPSQPEWCRWTKAPNIPPLGKVAGTWNGYGYEPDDILLVYQSGFSYGYNAIGASFKDAKVNRGLGSLWASPSPWLRASRVKTPSDMIAVSDVTPDYHEDYLVFCFLPTSLAGKNHGGGSNVLFCDGHVAWQPQKELDLSSLDVKNPDWQRRARMWNYDNQP